MLRWQLQELSEAHSRHNRPSERLAYALRRWYVAGRETAPGQSGVTTPHAMVTVTAAQHLASLA